MPPVGRASRSQRIATRTPPRQTNPDGTVTVAKLTPAENDVITLYSFAVSRFAVANIVLDPLRLSTQVVCNRRLMLVLSSSRVSLVPVLITESLDQSSR